MIYKLAYTYSPIHTHIISKKKCKYYTLIISCIQAYKYTQGKQNIRTSKRTSNIICIHHMCKLNLHQCHMSHHISKSNHCDMQMKNHII